MLVGAGVFASVAYADGYGPFHPLGGINPTTTIPQVYNDGSTGTLAQIGQMADSSVQQTDANQRNGYAKLDESGNVTVPISGPIPTAAVSSALTSSTTVPFSKILDAKRDFALMGARTDGTSLAKTSIDTLYGLLNNGDIVELPCGFVWPASPTGTASWGPDKTSPKMAWFKTNCTTVSGQFGGGPVTNPIGDSDVMENVVNGGKYIMRADYTKTLDSLHHFKFEHAASDGVLNWGGGTVYPDNYLGTTIEGQQDQYDLYGNYTNGSPVLSHLNYVDYSNVPWMSQPQALKINMVKYGSTPYWGALINMNQKGFYDASPWDAKAVDLELGGHGSIPDADHWSAKGFNRNVAIMMAGNDVLPAWAANTTFNTDCPAIGDPSGCSYAIHATDTAGIEAVYTAGATFTSGATAPNWGFGWITDNGITWVFKYRQDANKSPANVQTLKPWSSSTAYASGSLVTAPMPDGTTGVFEATGKATTGATVPTSWPANNGDTVVDGGVTWTRRVGYTYEADAAINFFADTSHGPQPYGIFGSAIIGNPLVYSAFLNTINMRCVDSTLCAAVRMAPDQQIDLSSDGTKAGSNLNTVVYSPGHLATEIRHNGAPVLSARNDGFISSERGIILTNRNKADILAQDSPVEGSMVYNTDSHIPVIYACPANLATGVNDCGWYPVQLGTKLSN